MTKRTSVILLCVVTVLVLFLGIFTFFPKTISYGEYNEYYSPVSLIQKSNALTKSIRGTYIVDYDDGVEFASVKSKLSKRLASVYSYYNITIDEVDGKIVVLFPQTDNAQNVAAASILSNVTKNGKIEILPNSNSTYSEESVCLGMQDYAKAKVRHYTQNGNDFYICQVTLTSEGTDKASALSTTSYNYVAVDGTVDSSNYAAYYSNGILQIYAMTQQVAELAASNINNGVLGATLTLDGEPETEREDATLANNGSAIFLICFGVVVLASWIFFIIRYNVLGIAGILSQAIATILATIFAAYVSFGMFNVCAAVAMVIAYVFMTLLTIYSFEKIRNYSAEKTFGTAKYKGFSEANKFNWLANLALLVLGIILWLIPTAVTAPVGNLFVYAAVVSFVATMGLNRLFAGIIAPFINTKANTKR